MATISVCMIVKNEERVLERCLESLKEIADEIIIADTGSTDRTKEIAKRYTDKIYDLEWKDDFAYARNEVAKRASCDYIYTADADEVIERSELEKFKCLKKVIQEDIDIVQMIYVNPDDINMAYNYTKELRPKLYKRIRTFRFTDPIHETLVLLPLVYDSDIEIKHCPENLHSKRDFLMYRKALERDGKMSDRLYDMYAKELFFSGEEKDFYEAEEIFRRRVYAAGTKDIYYVQACCVLAKILSLRDNSKELLSFCTGTLSDIGHIPAEMWFILAESAEKAGNVLEAAGWYVKSAVDAENYVCVKYGEKEALERAKKIYHDKNCIDEEKKCDEYLVLF